MTIGCQPRVLVLMACYNGARWVREQLETVLTQEDVDVRIIVRDDGSSDATLAELAHFANDERVMISPDSAPTGSAAQNFLKLIRETPGDSYDYIAFADQDDVWHPRKLSRACSMLHTRRGAGYSSATLATWPNGRTVVLRQAVDITACDFLFEGAGQGCTFVLESDFYSRIRKFAVSSQSLTSRVHYHDWMIYALARSWGLQWTFDSVPLLSYRQHGRNDTGARGGWNSTFKRLNLIRRGWYRDQLEAIAAICAAAAPDNATVVRWRLLLQRRNPCRRRLEIARLCLWGGRRRRLDNVVLTLAALAGWI